MKRRTLALLLAAALILTALGASVLAAEGDHASSAQTQGAGTEEPLPDASEETISQDIKKPQSAQETPEPQEENTDGDTEPAQDTQLEEYVPDEIGTLSFANLPRRMRENNLQILAIQQSVINLEEMDYDYILEGMRDQISSLSQAQWMMVMMGQQGTLAYEHLDEANQAVWNQFQAIKDGDLQKDNADVLRQLRNLQDQIVMAGEATYVALSAMEIQKGGLGRQLAALDRTLEELELRYELGHISSMTLKEARAGRTALTSGISTLDMNLDTYKGQLELLIGAEITGKIKLGPLPAVTQKELDAMDLEADLAAAKEASWQLYSAAKDVKDAKEAFADVGGELASDYQPKNPQYMQARYGYYASRYTYDNTVQNFELGVRNLYLKVKDYKQMLDAAKTALAVEQSNCSAAQLKHSQGTLSDNSLLEAQDKVSEAKEKVSSAENDLFSAYNTYRWAVDYGILN